MANKLSAGAKNTNVKAPDKSGAWIDVQKRTLCKGGKVKKGK
jgi:hypothetical protein